VQELLERSRVELRPLEAEPGCGLIGSREQVVRE
jgi:hypothetical protein